MRIRSLTLYKTNLDSEYKNVYDCYDTYSEYKEFLDLSFPLKHITLSSLKSRRDVGGKFDICLPYDSIELHDYNYICIENDIDKFIFAFVISVDSENDNPSSSSSILHCKFDSWTNNYIAIKGDSSGNVFRMNRCTFDALQYPNVYDKEFSPSAYATIDTAYASKSCFTIEGDSEDILGVKPEKLRVLWARVRVDPLKEFKDVTNDHTYNLGNVVETVFRGAYPDSPGYIITPIALLNGSKLIDINYWLELGTRGSPQSRTHYEFIGNTRKKLITPIGSYIYGAEYTFFTPFKYIVEIGRFPDGDYQGQIYCWIQTITEPQLIQYATDSLATFALFGYGHSPASNYTSTNSEIIYSRQFLPSVATYHNVYDRYASVWSNNIIEIDAMLIRYPYIRFKVSSGSTDIIISAQDGAELCVENYRYLNPSFFVTDSYGHATDNNYDRRITTKPNGDIDTMVNTLSDYLQSNRNRIEMQMYARVPVQVAKNTVSGLLSGNVGQAITGFIDPTLAVGDQMAKEHDISNYSSQINSGVGVANDDLFLQNEVMIIKEQGNWWEYNDMLQHALYNHKYGYKAQLNLTITYRMRDVFDYNQTLDANIIGAFNADDKLELNNAFNRGVRRWHILPSEMSAQRRIILRTFSVYTNNKYISLLEG